MIEFTNLVHIAVLFLAPLSVQLCLLDSLLLVSNSFPSCTRSVSGHLLTTSSPPPEREGTAADEIFTSLSSHFWFPHFPSLLTLSTTTRQTFTKSRQQHFGILSPCIRLVCIPSLEVVDTPGRPSNTLPNPLLWPTTLFGALYPLNLISLDDDIPSFPKRSALSS